MIDSFFLCYFETTRACNLNCAYCMARPAVPPSRPELTTDECKHLVLDEIRKVSTNAAVSFSGGEHLLRPDAYDILSYSASIGLYNFINTNGRLLVETDAVRRSMDASSGRLIFVLPLNSTDVELNRMSRDDTLSTVVAAAEKCRAEGADYFFIVTISRENLRTLDATLKYLKLNRVPVLRAPFVPRGAGALFPEYMFDRSDMQNVIHPALTANPLAYISFTPFFASPEHLDAVRRRHDVRIEGLGCQAGRAFAAVGAEGDVTPCVQLLDSACTRGNVRDTPLSLIISDDPVFKGLRSRDSIKGKCSRCRYVHSCGGCRALAFYHTGDIFAEDPTCFFEPSSVDDHSEFEDAQNAQLDKFVEYIKYNEPWNVLF
ncbi:MAG: radical SAM protein [Planctomycetes bacterium]|nr:radical SAM protein [Planctomycetota bacterium]